MGLFSRFRYVNLLMAAILLALIASVSNPSQLSAQSYDKNRVAVSEARDALSTLGYFGSGFDGGDDQPFRKAAEMFLEDVGIDVTTGLSGADIVVLRSALKTEVQKSATDHASVEVAKSLQHGKVVVSQNDQRALHLAGNGLELWDLASRRTIPLLRRAAAQAGALNKDGTLVALGGFSGVRLYDVSRNRVLASAALPEPLGASAYISSLAFHPAGDLIFVGDSVGRFFEWRPAIGLRQFGSSIAASNSSVIHSIDITPDASLALTASGHAGSTIIWDLKIGRRAEELPLKFEGEPKFDADAQAVIGLIHDTSFMPKSRTLAKYHLRLKTTKNLKT